MTVEEIEAIVGGYHGDAFRILGPHAARKKSGQLRWEVRAFLPQAESAEISTSRGRTPMAKLHAQGFFCVSLDGNQESYAIHLKLWDGREIQIEDPYRFGPLISDADLYLHGEGTLHEAYRTFGGHLVESEGVKGVRFAVWAPNAEDVTVVGDFNEWDVRRHPMRKRSGGVWELFLPGLAEGATYKYYVRSRLAGYQQLKADPYGFLCETPPKSASVVWDINRYQWNDAGWLEQRAKTNWLKSPVSIYEVHLESWMRGPQGKPLTYREMGAKLVEYVRQMGYTHVELMPVMEHPFLRIVGLPGDRLLRAHLPLRHAGRFQVLRRSPATRRGIGVILDWVPAHFPKDAHGLAFFDGTALYEHDDPRKGEHRDWGTLIFNYGRNEVRSVPDLERPVLAEGVSHRRPARGRRGLHALPRLLAQGRRVDSQPVRRATKTWRPSTSCAASTNWPTRFPAPSPSPRNPPRFPACRGPSTWAAWASP